MNNTITQNDPQTQLLANYLIDQGRFPQGARILEIGCGEASLLARIFELRPDLHCCGVDASANTIASAKERLPAGQFAVANLSEPIPSLGPFDRIFSYGLAQRFTLLQFVELNERLSRSLLPRGVLHHFGVPNAKQSFQYTMQKWQSRHGAALGAVVGGVDAMVTKWTCRYDQTSYWHDPEIMQGSLRHLGTVQLRIPADAWFRFDIKILP